ncbi:DUF4238 domain-containing protein [Duganella sp. CY15W]|uniref:DUF4238 domain-containing protein n=1 Tax=Duganella sp. CY15W TaxID=2692172 RepID=UPI001367AFE0|nr:DUF4238 domain-containing protein [Duganella sp. CY15W]
MSQKHLEVKKRHHYVWASYLARWGSGTNNVFYTTKTGKIAQDSVRAIVVEDYFYKITTLTRWHVEVIDRFSRKSPDDLHQQHMSLLREFLKVQQAEAMYRKSGKLNQEAELHFHALNCSLLENLHAEHEKLARPVLEALAEENLGVLQDDSHMMNFMAFFGHQISRTKPFRDGVIQVLSRSNALEIQVALAMEHVWWFLSYMFGMNLGRNLFLDRRSARHALLINDTSVPFITSDQPIVNVHPSVSMTDFTPPEHSDFYYPISPRIAYIICDSARFTAGKNKINEDAVIEFNSKVAARARVHIIGNTSEAITPFQNFIARSYQKAPDRRVVA